MQIQKMATAGTLESSDVFVQLFPGDGTVSIQVESVVLAQFGEAIEAAVRDELDRHGVTDVRVRIQDRGALECVLRARVETALLRGTEVQDA